MTESHTPHASIIVPVRNGMPIIERCLRGILAQQTHWPVEVIVIDSSSTDGTWEFLETLPVTRLRIDPREFNHGRTRNLGAQHARGEFLVFMVQDAIPADEHWLANLISAVEQPGVVGAYSRQLPRTESRLITKYMTIGATPADQMRKFKSLPSGMMLCGLHPLDQFKLSLFQNNSSCIRRLTWMDQPFSAIPYGEDIDWGKRAIQAGHTIVYEPSSLVHHSHDRSALYALKRAYADHYLCAQLFSFVMIPSVARMLRITASQILNAWRFILAQPTSASEKLSAAVTAPVYLTAASLGQYAGPRMFRWIRRGGWYAKLDRQLRIGV